MRLLSGLCVCMCASAVRFNQVVDQVKLLCENTSWRCTNSNVLTKYVTLDMSIWYNAVFVLCYSYVLFLHGNDFGVLVSEWVSECTVQNRQLQIVVSTRLDDCKWYYHWTIVLHYNGVASLPHNAFQWAHPPHNTALENDIKSFPSDSILQYVQNFIHTACDYRATHE